MGSFVYMIARDDADIIEENGRNSKNGWSKCLMQQV